MWAQGCWAGAGPLDQSEASILTDDLSWGVVGDRLHAVQDYKITRTGGDAVVEVWNIINEITTQILGILFEGEARSW